MWLAGYFREYILTIAAITLHEAAHVITALFLHCKLYAISLLPVGLKAYIKKAETDKLEWIIIYISGPLANIILFVLCRILNSYYSMDSSSVSFFASANIYLAALNLLPVMPLDGGRILNQLMKKWMGLYSTERYTKKISICIGAIIILLGIVQVFSNHYNISLILIGGIILVTLKSEKKEVAMLNIKSIMFRRARLLKKGVYPVRNLVVLKSMGLKDVVKSMDFDRFHIIHVLDDDLRLIGMMSEQEMLDTLIKGDMKMTFEGYLNSGKKGV